MIEALLVAVSEEQLRSDLRQDLPLLILGSIIAAIGLGAVVVHLFRRRPGERVLLWFGLFAGPYGLRLLTNTTPFQMALGQSLRFWPYVSRLIEYAIMVPALLLFEDYYGRGWRSSVRWVTWVIRRSPPLPSQASSLSGVRTSFPPPGLELFFCYPWFSCWDG